MKSGDSMETEISTAVKQRSAYWDNIKGILMILTVFAHILLDIKGSGATRHLTNYIYTFHMPVFVFISGYFGKSENSRSSRSVLRLLFLYIVFNSFMGFVFGFESILQPVNHMWYLFALMVWRLSAHRIAGFPMIIEILIFISLFAGFEMTLTQEFAAARIVGFFPFYMAGYLFKKESSDKILTGAWSKRIISGLLFLVPSCFLMYFSDKIFKYTLSQLCMSSYTFAEDCVGRICIYIISFMMVFAFLNLTPSGKIPFITSVGRYSLPVFVLHRPVTLLIDDQLKGFKEPVKVSIAIVLTILICLIFGNAKVSAVMNSYADKGAELFDGKGKKKIGIAMFSIIAVLLGFVILLAADVYSSFDPSELDDLHFGKERSDNNIYMVVGEK